MRPSKRIWHLNASLTNPIQVRFKRGVKATEETDMVHYREIVTGMVLKNNQRTLRIAKELSQLGGGMKYGYSGLWSSTFVERQVIGLNFQLTEDQNKIREFSKKAKAKVYTGFSSIQFPIWFSFMTQYNQSIWNHEPESLR